MPKIKIAYTKADLSSTAQSQLARWYLDHCKDKIVELKVWFFTFNLELNVLEGLFEMLTGMDLSCH